jgi:hypothetical protein
MFYSAFLLSSVLGECNSWVDDNFHKAEKLKIDRKVEHRVASRGRVLAKMSLFRA